MILEVIPRRMPVPPAALGDLERLVLAWFTWLTDRQQVPARYRGRLRLAVQQAGESFRRHCTDPGVNPALAYVADLPAQPFVADQVSQALARRTFAIPPPGARGDGEVELASPANGLPAGRTHVDQLDAARPAHRRLIAGIEQSSHGGAATDTRAWSEVAEQLWDDDPPQVWRAARRLLDGGYPRAAVVERLAGTRRRHPAGGTHDPGYLRALADLGVTVPRP